MWQNDYIKIPFLDRGRDRSGCDCWGLVRLVYKEQLNIELPDYKELYTNTHDKAAICDIIDDEKLRHWYEPEFPQPFDVIILRLLGVPMHVGIVISEGLMLHCSQGIGTAIERYDSLRWRKNVIGFERHKHIKSICIPDSV